MPEETKKPRRKRRTKAQIEADKAAKEAALEKEDQEPTVLLEEPAKEEPVVSVKPVITEPPLTKPAEEPYIELTGLAKIRARVATRKYRDIR